MTRRFLIFIFFVVILAAWLIGDLAPTAEPDEKPRRLTPSEQRESVTNPKGKG